MRRATASLPARWPTRGLSLSAQRIAPAQPYTFSVGATVQDVYAEESGVRRDLEFAPRVQAVATAAYAFRRAGGVTLDYTGRVVGPMQLPVFPDRAARSAWYGEHHVQATWSPTAGLQLYAAVKNVLGFRQRDPLVGAHDPFGDGFDTFHVYGPLQGRRRLLGTRYDASR